MMFGLSGYLGDKNFKPTTNILPVNRILLTVHLYTYTFIRIRRAGLIAVKAVPSHRASHFQRVCVASSRKIIITIIII